MKTLTKRILTLMIITTMIFGMSLTVLAGQPNRPNTTVSFTYKVLIDELSTNEFEQYAYGVAQVPEGTTLYEWLNDSTTPLNAYEPHFSNGVDEQHNNQIVKYMDSFFYWDEAMDMYGTNYTYGWGWSFFVNGDRPAFDELEKPNGAQWLKAIDQYEISNNDVIELKYGYSYSGYDSDGFLTDFEYLAYGEIH